MVDNKLLPKLSQNLLEILNDEEYYDIIIEVGNDPYVKVFRAHMVILNYRSPYLRRILSTNKKKNDEILTNIKLQNVSPEFFHVLLRYYFLLTFLSFYVIVNLTSVLFISDIFMEENFLWKNMMLQISLKYWLLLVNSVFRNYSP